jgi:hypothetical protein
LVEILVREGCSINAHNNSHATLLHMACQECDVALIESLIVRPDVDVDALDEFSMCASPSLLTPIRPD